VVFTPLTYTLNFPFNNRITLIKACTGTSCDTGMVLADCQTSNRCRNNATCIDQHDDNITCECWPPWTGIYCDQVGLTLIVVQVN